MNPEMSGSPSKQKRKWNQKRKCEIDSNDADQIKFACMDVSPKPTEQQARLSYKVIAKSGSEDLDIENIEKAKTDKQDYCYLKLDNDLRVLVVSDSECEMANVHLMVKCGTMNDPETVPGLAHCLEHMIYLTNMESYPHINQFDYHLHEFSGSNSATTSPERSAHSISVPSRYLSEAMTRFSKTIVQAKFDVTRYIKEVNVIDTEFEYKDKETTLFWAALVKDNPDHPFGREGCGNKETLVNKPMNARIHAPSLMKKLYEAHYISSNMCLVLIGKEAINMLIKMVVDSEFGHMPKKEPTTVSRGHVIKQTKRVAFINYDFKTRNSLEIQWKIDSYSWTYPVKYINTLIGNTGTKGLLATLRERGWAYEISADFKDLCTDSTIYFVNIYLTLKGVIYYEEVVDIVYSYIFFVEENNLDISVMKKLDTMCKKMVKHEFVYNQNREDYAAFLCGRLWDVCNHDFKVKYLLKNYALPEKDMNHFLSQLRPDNCRIVVSGYNICDVLKAIVEVKLNFTPKTKYCPSYDIHNIDEETIRKWEKGAIKYSFDLIPCVAKYYEKDEEYKIPVPELEERISSEPELPELIQRTKKSTVWYKQDKRRGVLHPFASFRLCVTPASLEKEHHDLFVALWIEHLQDLLYQADFGGLTITILNENHMFTVLVEGHPEYLKECVDSIIIGMLEVFLTEEATYDKCQEWEKGIVEKNYQSFKTWLFEMAQNVQRLFLICGHISKDEALYLCDTVNTNVFHKEKEEKEEKKKNRKVEIPNYRYSRIIENVEGKRRIFAEFDCSGACEEFGVAIVDLFCHVFWWDCYTFLRSLCTLTYQLEMEEVIIDKQKRISSMVIWMKAKGDHDSAQMEIEYFLIVIIKTRFEQLSEKTFAYHKAALEMKSKREPINQKEAYSNYWTSLLESTSGAKDEKYFIDLATGKKKYSTELDNIKLSDLKNFYAKYIHPEGDRVKYTITGAFKHKDQSVYLSARNNKNLSTEISKMEGVLDTVHYLRCGDDKKTMFKFRFQRSPDKKP